ncbi:hypothetical protein ACFSTI_15025 [Rhizorhabdus histidinilytica]
MTRLTEEAVRAGALGVGTSRTLFHRSSDGMAVPTKDAAEVELDAIAQGLARAGAGIIQVALDFLDADTLESDIRMIGRVARARAARRASTWFSCRRRRGMAAGVVHRRRDRA